MSCELLDQFTTQYSGERYYQFTKRNNFWLMIGWWLAKKTHKCWDSPWVVWILNFVFSSWRIRSLCKWHFSKCSLQITRRSNFIILSIYEEISSSPTNLMGGLQKEIKVLYHFSDVLKARYNVPRINCVTG